MLAVSFTCLSVIFFAIVWYRLAMNPEGRYIEDKIGSTGLSYFEFKNGEVSVVIHESYDRLGSKEVYRDMFAIYTRRDGEWMLTSVHDDEPITLKAGWLSIRWVNSSGQVMNEVPRLFSIGGRVYRIYKP
ncbi:MAG: hypothetical protein K0Q55_2608 [Verrucomicrobia bacterium]|nr:hypothetical protein [Verrucomicrobiota bacterium]